MEDKTSLVFTARYNVNGHDVNGDKYLTIPMLLRSMQECSLKHAINLKASIWDMEDDKVSWVLIRKELKIIDHLQMDDIYTIITYPSGFDKFFAHRDYLVFNEDKKLIAGASSTWTLIDTDTRKLVRIPEKIMNIGVPEKVKFLAKAESKLSVSKDAKIVDSRKVRAYDLDWNNHVNNIVLSRFMLEPLKDFGVEDQNIKKIIFHFKNEVKSKDMVEISSSQIDNGYEMSIKNQVDNSTVAMCKVVLEYCKVLIRRSGQYIIEI